jgi:hypothetical protein
MKVENSIATDVYTDMNRTQSSSWSSSSFVSEGEVKHVHTSDGDTTRDDTTFGHLDKYLGHSSPLNCAGECNMKGYRSIDDIMVSTQQYV